MNMTETSVKYPSFQTKAVRQFFSVTKLKTVYFSGGRDWPGAGRGAELEEATPGSLRNTRHSHLNTRRLDLNGRFGGTYMEGVR